jgi:dTMP kinase
MPQVLPNGFLVAFEGIDGVGKTTQLGLANEALIKDGWPILTRRNLGGTPIGEELRNIIKGSTPRPALTNLYISVAIQAALLEQVKKDRHGGNLILMDRSPLSLAAYESFGSGLDDSLSRPYVDDGIKQLRPNLIIIYKARVEPTLERAKRLSKQADFFESHPLDYFERVAAGYDELAKRYENVICLDAEQSIAAVHKATMKSLQQALAKFA